MAQNIRLRRIDSPPRFRGYRPYGSIKNKKEVHLFYEEYETLKLADYRFLYHKEASELMGISRATFSRIYENARRKIAKALVENRPILSVYSNSWDNSDWFIYSACNVKFNIPNNIINCPLCKTKNIEILKNKTRII